MEEADLMRRGGGGSNPGGILRNQRHLEGGKFQLSRSSLDCQKQPVWRDQSGLSVGPGCLRSIPLRRREGEHRVQDRGGEE